MNMRRYLHIVVGIICILSFASCTPTKFAGMQKRRILSDYEQEYIIKREYPHMSEYFKERVIWVTKLNEYRDLKGNVYYDLGYIFKSRKIRDYNEQMRVLRENFPEIYDLYKQGKVVLSSVKVYVKRKTIRYNIEYYHRK